MGRQIFIFISFLLLSGCINEKAPVTHYDNNQLVPVMVDLFIASAALKDIDEIYKDSLTTLYREQIAKIHQVDFNKIDEDIAVLQKYPKMYKELHSIVSDSIVYMEKRMSAASNTKNKKRN